MKDFVKRSCCIGIIAILFANCCFLSGGIYAKAQEKTEQYIVITEDEATTQSIVEEYEATSESNQTAVVNLTYSEAAELESDKTVICVEQDFIIEEEIQNDWDMEKPKNEGWNLKAVNAENATTDEKVKVAILDSGVDYTTDIKVKERKNFIEDDPVTMPLYEDTCGHGTSVASVISSKGIESNARGINSSIELYSARVLDVNKQAPISRIIEAIYWAMEKDVNIINMSFGTREYSEALKVAIDAAVEQGILIIAAAGNYSDERVDYPAAFDNVIAVGSINAEGSISDFSSTGEKVDLYAPGEAILAQCNFGQPLNVSGTSLAAAHITGIAACLWSQNLSQSSTFISTLMELSSKDINESTEPAMLVDYEQAVEVYDDVETQYNEIICKLGESSDREELIEEKIGEAITVEENIEDVKDYSDSETVIGSWGSTVHQKYCENLEMKKGAVYADRHSAMKGIGDNPEFHGFAWHNDSGGGLGSGDCNYMANYRFLVKVANAYGNDGGYLTVKFEDIDGLDEECYDRMVDGFKSIKQHDLNDVESCKYCGVVNIWNKDNDKLQKAFVMGLAMHVATDTFAHSSFRRKDAGVTSWTRITHLNDAADDVSNHPRRVEMAYATEKKVVDRYNGERGNYHTCNDFYNGASGAYTDLDFRVTKIKTFAEAAGYTNENVLAKFGKLQTLN